MPSLIQPMSVDSSKPDVVRAMSIGWPTLHRLFQPYGLTIEVVPDKQEIPGSHWGDDEAGLIASTLYARADTPVHSILHEAGHWLLMEPQRREQLHTDAGGSSAEENAVCYLQILMADQVDGYSSERMLLDMDRWGYSFRLGSTRRWFEEDAEDARLALVVRLPHLATEARPFDVARLGYDTQSSLTNAHETELVVERMKMRFYSSNTTSDGLHPHQVTKIPED